MTKHVSPEAGTTELIGTYYIRSDDGAIMRERVPGIFVRMVQKHPEQEVLEEDTGPVINDLDSFDDRKESPKRLGLKFMQSELEKLFDDKDDSADDEDGPKMRRVKTAPKCNRAISQRVRTTPRKIKSADAGFDPCNHFRFRNRLVAPLAILKIRCTIAWSPTARFRQRAARELRLSPFFVLSETCEEPSKSRARQERYSAEAPKNDSEILPRKPRNASPTREKDDSRLNVWAEYRRLNGSLEPLQTGYGKSDGDNYEYADSAAAEGGEKPEAKYPLDSTLENRPSVDEMKVLWPAAEYETRMVHASDYPRLVEPGYCLTCGKTEMKIPVSGRVECIGYHKRVISDLEDAARKYMGVLEAASY